MVSTFSEADFYYYIIYWVICQYADEKNSALILEVKTFPPCYRKAEKYRCYSITMTVVKDFFCSSEGGFNLPFSVSVLRQYKINHPSL